MELVGSDRIGPNPPKAVEVVRHARQRHPGADSRAAGLHVEVEPGNAHEPGVDVHEVARRRDTGETGGDRRAERQVIGHSDVGQATGVEPDAGRGRLVEDVVGDHHVARAGGDDDLAVAPRVGADERVVHDRQPVHARAAAVVALDRPAVREVVEDVVPDHEVVALTGILAALVDTVIVVLPVARAGGAPLLTRPEPTDVVHHVPLDGEVPGIGVDADPPTHVVAAHVPHVVDVVRHDIHVVAVVGVDAVPAGAAHFEPFDPDVAAVDLETHGRGVVTAVEHGPPAVRGAEHQPPPRPTAPAHRPDAGAPRIDAGG